MVGRSLVICYRVTLPNECGSRSSSEDLTGRQADPGSSLSSRNIHQDCYFADVRRLRARLRSPGAPLDLLTNPIHECCRPLLLTAPERFLFVPPHIIIVFVLVVTCTYASTPEGHGQIQLAIAINVALSKPSKREALRLRPAYFQSGKVWSSPPLG